MFLVIAMILSAAAVKAYEQGKVRTRTRWEEARFRAEERGARREHERQERAAAWSAWFDKGVSSGPRHPMWWAYAAGWTTGGAIAAIGAGAVGVYSGAIAGGKSGYRLGIEAGKKGRKYGEAFRAWKARNRWPGDPVELGICGRCNGWIAKRELVSSKEYGEVCPDCVPEPSYPPGDDDEPYEDVVHERRTGDVPPPQCANRCGMSAAAGSDLCALCQIEAINRWERAQEQRREQEQARSSTPPPPHAGQQEQNGPIRVDAERIYPDQEEETQPKEITNTMAELMPANSSEIAGTGEGLGDTLHTLNALAALLNKAHEEMTSLGDNLTANSLDADTLSRINELNDLLDTATPMAQELHRHVENRHNPVADAMSAAGGSNNVATKTFYDDH